MASNRQSEPCGRTADQAHRVSKRILRWAIGSREGPRSSVWRLWGNKKGDIYVAVRELGGIIKASFHRDGKCHVGFTSEFADEAKKRFGVTKRHWETWTLPAEHCVRVVQILIPGTELRIFTDRDGGDVTWLVPPDPNSIGTVSVVLVRGSWTIELDDSLQEHFVGEVQTGTCSTLVFYAQTPMDNTLAQKIGAARASLGKLPVDYSVPSGTQVVFWDSRPDHDRHVLELAYEH